MDGWMDACVDGWMDGWINGSMDQLALRNHISFPKFNPNNRENADFLKIASSIYCATCVMSYVYTTCGISGS